MYSVGCQNTANSVDAACTNATNQSCGCNNTNNMLPILLLMCACNKGNSNCNCQEPTPRSNNGLMGNCGCQDLLLIMLLCNCMG